VKEKVRAVVNAYSLLPASNTLQLRSVRSRQYPVALAYRISNWFAWPFTSINIWF